MINRVFVGILAFVLLFAFAGAISDGIKTWRSDPVDITRSADTGAGADNATVVLPSDPFGDSVSDITISSNVSGDDPSAESYVSPDLLVGGLLESQSRTLTIDYYTETEDEVMQALGPFLQFFIFGGCAGAILWGMFKGKR